jgi:hypothetical protein
MLIGCDTVITVTLRYKIHFPGLLGAVSRVQTQWNLRAQLPWTAGAQIHLGDGAGVITYDVYIRRVRLVDTCWLL